MRTQERRLRLPASGSGRQGARRSCRCAPAAGRVAGSGAAREGGRESPGGGRQHAAAVGGLQGRRRRGEAPAAGRRQGGAGQQLRRHADEPCRRGGQHRDAEGAARGGRRRRVAQRGRDDGAPGGVAHGHRRSREAAAGPRRQGGCEGEVGRADAADVGLGAPASGDDAAAHLQGRRRQRGLDRPRLPAARDGRGASQEPGQRRADAFALRRARELHGVRGRAAEGQRGHRPARIRTA